MHSLQGELPEISRLLSYPIPAEPDGFVDFWRGLYAEALAIDLHIQRREIDSPNPRLRLEEIEYTSLDGVRIGGWLTTPVDAEPVRGVVMSHGYGGREAPDLNIPGPPAAALMPCARGFHRSAHRTIPGLSKQHVLHGIESVRSYVHGGCVADQWCAASALLQLYPQLSDHLHYIGGSFGGGIGAMALGWDRRFTRAALRVPSFGNHPVRLTIACTGSGEAVRLYHQQHPEVTQVLAFYDSAVHARHILCPTLFECALVDPGVPPPGQFSVYAAAGCMKKLLVREAGHMNHPANAVEDQRGHIVKSIWFGI